MDEQEIPFLEEAGWVRKLKKGLYVWVENERMWYKYGLISMGFSLRAVKEAIESF